MHTRCVATLLASTACVGPRAPAHEGLSPRELSAKVSVIVAMEGGVDLPRDCFEQLYEAMRRDNPRQYACMSGCARASDGAASLRACLQRDRCDDFVPAPDAGAGPSDPRIAELCDKLIAIDQENPRLGARSCALIASWATPAQLSCMSMCAKGATSNGEYQLCLTRTACQRQ